MKKTVPITFAALLIGCSVIDRPSHYPENMVIDTKVKDGRHWHYLDGKYDLKAKSRKFEEGDTLYFKEFGKKYLIVKKWKN